VPYQRPRGRMRRGRRCLGGSAGADMRFVVRLFQALGRRSMRYTVLCIGNNKGQGLTTGIEWKG